MFAPIVIALALPFISPVVASCGRGLPFIDPFQHDAEGHVAIPTFSYGTTTGPLNWHNLNTTANFLCGNGTNVGLQWYTASLFCHLSLLWNEIAKSYPDQHHVCTCSFRIHQAGRPRGA
jgi:hypothetical protein